MTTQTARDSRLKITLDLVETRPQFGNLDTRRRQRVSRRRRHLAESGNAQRQARDPCRKKHCQALPTRQHLLQHGKNTRQRQQAAQRHLAKSHPHALFT